jgi:hypothetical protein
MDLPFTDKPGRRERHLLRRHRSPLFAWPPIAVSPEELLAAQKADHEEMEAFRATFADLVRRAAGLPADVGSDTILALKSELERCYEQSCGLPEDHGAEREAIARLISAIMRTLRRHIAPGDALARRELDDEEVARSIHFRLLEHPLVADLLHPESPIQPQELTAAVLSATDAEREAAVQLFDAAQLAVIVDEAEALLARLGSAGPDLGAAERALDWLRGALADAASLRTAH